MHAAGKSDLGRRFVHVGTALALAVLWVVPAVPAGAEALSATAPSGHAGHSTASSRRALGGEPDRSARHGRISVPGRLPVSVNLSRFNPPVGYQGDLNSCSAWASDYYLRGWYAMRDGYYPTGPDSLGGFAPMFTYAPYTPGLGLGHGETFAGNLSIQQSEGVDSRADYWQGDYDQTDQPTNAEKVNASQYKIATYTDLGNPGGKGMEKLLKATLAGGNPTGVDLTVYPEFENASPAAYLIGLPTPQEQQSGPLGYHDVFAYAYDQNGLWIENQWGTGWGDNGYAELSWAFVNSYVNESVTIVPISPPPRQPDGTFVSYRGDVYRVAGGAALYVSNWAPVGGPQQTTALTEPQWAVLAHVPADGTLLSSSSGVFVVAGGAPLYVRGWAAIGGPQPAVAIDSWDIANAGTNRLDHLDMYPADGTLLRTLAGQYYTVESARPQATSNTSPGAVLIPASDISHAGQPAPWNHLL